MPAKRSKRIDDDEMDKLIVESREYKEEPGHSNYY